MIKIKIKKQNIIIIGLMQELINVQWDEIQFYSKLFTCV